ncbi:restriction endonuclease subunit S [Methylomonas sp. MO1]|uniref:restriction endonuclease subunit S n=1 Tax=Methylomonas sp. MO1 TaxID=3073619 RepID=UPI0028A4D745|nr:restriction endonuclease subunit S [Methylomonas sp. MO1]MDT4291616.1 restriction endonuclease subunit S [Methylomonas sp. MO1]
MSRWPTVELGEVLHTQIDAVESAELETVNLAGVYGFARGLFRREPISPLDTTYKRFHRLNAGDFVISSPKAWEGAIARIPEEFDGWFLSPVFPTFTANPDRLDTRYLDWYCKREAVWTQLQGKAKGMGARRESVSPAQFLSLNVPLPSIDEQRTIVARLDQLAEKVRQIDLHLDAIDAVAEALLISLHHKFAAERMVRLGDIIELSEESEPIKPDGRYPQVGVRGFGGGLFAKPALAGTETSYRAFNRLYADAIVLSQVKGWEGALAVCPPELAGMFVSPEYRTFRCKPDLASPAYLGELIRTPWFWSLLQAATRGVGARRERTRPEQFLNIELPMPELNEQLKIVEILSRQNELKQRHAKIREANQALIPATLERLFSNEFLKI